MFTRTFSVGRNRALRLAVSLVLALGLVLGMMALMGCPMDDDDDDDPNSGFIPVGNWGFSGNGYNIDNTTVEYYSPEYPAANGQPAYPASKLEGDIAAAVDFSKDSGVMIIKITNAKNIGNTVGKYTAVYYKDFTSSHIFLANPIDGNYNPIEVGSLNEALSTFTAGNMGTHVTMWGTGYNKQ